MVLKSTRRAEGLRTSRLSELFGGTPEKLLPRTASFPQEQHHLGSVVLALLFSSAPFLFYFQ